MGEVVWDPRKNERLKAERGVSFDDVVEALAAGRVIRAGDNPNQAKYPGQQVFIVEINGYAHVVPYYERDGAMELKTIIPSRKAHREYRKGGAHGGKAGSK